MGKTAKYRLSSAELKLLGAIERSVGKSAFRNDPRRRDLSEMYGDTLAAALHWKPTRAPGKWAAPSLSRCKIAAQMIIRSVVRFVDHDVQKVASAQKVRAQLLAADEQLRKAVRIVARFRKRTRNWVGKHLADAHEDALYEMGLHPIGGHVDSFERWRADLEEKADQAHDFATTFPLRSEQNISTAARLCYRRIALIWFDTTGHWPVTSVASTWAPALAELKNSDEQHEPISGESGALPLLLLLQLMAGKVGVDPRSLEREPFIRTVKELRRRSEWRAALPPRRRPKLVTSPASN